MCKRQAWYLTMVVLWALRRHCENTSGKKWELTRSIWDEIEKREQHGQLVPEWEVHCVVNPCGCYALLEDLLYTSKEIGTNKRTDTEILPFIFYRQIVNYSFIAIKWRKTPFSARLNVIVRTFKNIYISIAGNKFQEKKLYIQMTMSMIQSLDHKMSYDFFPQNTCWEVFQNSRCNNFYKFSGPKLTIKGYIWNTNFHNKSSKYF